MITNRHILRRLRFEYPLATIKLVQKRGSDSGVLYFIANCTDAVRNRAKELQEKAILFNAHLALEHRKSTRDWWKIQS